jgi:P4 family phage/plasmid primase-like protien
MTSRNQQALRPGEINLAYIPMDWPLTPLGAKKDPYVNGWQNKPFSVREVEEEIVTGNCRAIGLMGGPVYNLPYGLIWVDIDGSSVYELVEGISDMPILQALPPTLTIMSGKIGRERKLYKLSREKHKHFARNKYTWHAEEDKEKLEILWQRHQGVLMGLHPETEGYFTAEGQGFEWVDELPEFPDWLLNAIINKNVRQGTPAKERTRIVGPNFAVNSEVSLERDMKLATEAMWALPPEATDDYDIWITIGQTLHSLDESLLENWDEWSKQSEKYKDGECHRRWRSFSKDGGRGLGSLIHIAQEHGWKPSQEHRAMNVDDDTLEHVSKLLAVLEEDLPMAPEMLAETNAPVAPTAVAAPMWASKTKQVSTEKTGKDQRTRNPSSNVITDVVLGLYKGDLLYSQPHGQFFLYQKEAPGLWSSLTKIEILGDIRTKLQQLGDFLPNGFSSNLMNDICAQLQSVLTFEDWYDGTDLLLFTNGVLNVDTRELLPFTREMHLIQLMPYPYDPSATCEEIVKWLKNTQHESWERTQVLRAWLRATLLGRYEIQKFVEIVGPGKSGKSTYANLAVALVGKSNTYSTDFDNMEKNRFEAAAYMGKKLLLFQDADRWGGSVSRLKAITGNDWIRSERKYQGEALDPFQYHGVVMITANEAIQSTDYTSGLARRRLTIPFDRPFTGGHNEQKELIKFNSKGEPQGVFAPLLSGLVNWLLDMSEDEMREYLMETSKKVKFFKKYEKMQNLRSNPLLDWMEHKIIYDPGISSAVGFTKNAPMGSSHIYANQDKWLYASYAEFCRQCNVGIMSRNRFEPLFIDVCKHQLKINAFPVRNTRGMRMVNVAVRESSPKYEGWPSVVEVSSDKEKYKEFYGMSLETNPDATMEDELEITDV